MTTNIDITLPPRGTCSVHDLAHFGQMVDHTHSRVRDFRANLEAVEVRALTLLEFHLRV